MTPTPTDIETIINSLGAEYVEYDGDTHTFTWMDRDCFLTEPDPTAMIGPDLWIIGHTWDISTQWEQDHDEWATSHRDLGKLFGDLAQRFIAEDVRTLAWEQEYEREEAREAARWRGIETLEDLA